MPGPGIDEATRTAISRSLMASAIITGMTFFVVPSTAKNTFTLDEAVQRQLL